MHEVGHKTKQNKSSAHGLSEMQTSKLIRNSFKIVQNDEQNKVKFATDLKCVYFLLYCTRNTCSLREECGEKVGEVEQIYSVPWLIISPPHCSKCQ